MIHTVDGSYVTLFMQLLELFQVKFHPSTDPYSPPAPRFLMSHDQLRHNTTTDQHESKIHVSATRPQQQLSHSILSDPLPSQSLPAFSAMHLFLFAANAHS